MGISRLRTPSQRGLDHCRRREKGGIRAEERKGVFAELCMRPSVYSNEVPRVGIREKPSFRPSFLGI